MPTSEKVLMTMLAVLPAHLPNLPDGGKTGFIAELGSGWGGVAIALAKRYPNHQIVGYEVSVLPFLFCRLRLMLFPQKNLKILRSDFMQIELSSAALAICYLAPDSMIELASKLEREMRAGALVLTNTFSFRDWQELDRKTAPDIYRSPVYLYEIGST
jgi:hypothetical protein